MGMMSLAFEEPMKRSLQLNRVYIVDTLINIEGIMDHLVQEHVFHDSEYILVERTAKDKVRKLLENLPRRPAKDYWTFVTCLYNDRICQGHIAEVILQTYVQNGGNIGENVRKLRQDYLDSQRLHSSNPQHPHPSQQNSSHLVPQYHQLTYNLQQSQPQGDFQLMPTCQQQRLFRDGDRCVSDHYIPRQGDTQLKLPIQVQNGDTWMERYVNVKV